MTTEKEYGWDDALPPPNAYEILPEGDAEFEVLALNRDRKEMGKLGLCNVAIVTLLVSSFNRPGAGQKMDCNLPLHPSISFKLYQFFAAIGQYKHGEVEGGKPFVPKWNTVIGATGLCVIKHKAWKKRDGSDAISHEIDAFLDEQGRSGLRDKPRGVGPTPAKDVSFD